MPDDGHNELRHRLRIWLEQLDEKDSLEGVVESMRQLEQSLNEDADKSIIEREESMPIDLDDWRTEGHVFIGKRLAREIKGRYSTAPVRE